MEKIRCYELEFATGDTNVISKDIQVILDIIKAEMTDLKGRDMLSYTISLKFMTESQYKKLPEWS